MNHSDHQASAQSAPSAQTVSGASYVALIPAAGVGARMGGEVPKQYVQIHGQSILQYSVDAFLNVAEIARVVVVVSPADAYVDTLLSATHHAGRLQILRCGGATRSESVRNGLQQILARAWGNAQDWVLVHDAARPGITPSLIRKLMNQIDPHAVGGLLALPVVDTVKRVLSGSRQLQEGAADLPMAHVDENVQTVVQTVERAGLWLAQTPQMFRCQLLYDALQRAELSPAQITDEASAIEAMGLAPCLVEGHPRNNKLTRPEDLALIEFYLSQSMPDD